ncbi:MAG: hypothetical protein J6N52_00105 [Clostridia bacterium]|nr:hypothetical protein [Clostridia bacterium]
MFKKFLAGMLAVFMLNMTVCADSAETKQSMQPGTDLLKQYGDKVENILSMNFEKGSPEFDNRKTSQYAQKADAEHGTVYAMTGKGSQWKTFSEPAHKDVVLISYDLNLPSKGSLSYVRLLSSAFTNANAANDPNMIETFGINVGGSAGYYSNSVGWTLNAVESLTLNEWHNASIWLEIDVGKIYYCIDNRIIGESTFNTDELVDLNGVLFSYDNRTGSGLSIDNVEVMKIDRAIISDLLKDGLAVPEPLLATVDISAKVGGIGNSVFEPNKEIPSEVTVFNKLSQAQELKIIMTARSRAGSSFFERKDVINVGAEESAVIEFNIPGVSRYGYYDLYVDVYGNADQEAKTSGFYEFALINAPPAGTRNPKTSIINHVRIARMGDPAVNLEMVDKAGFSGARSEVSWSLYEPVAGERAIPENYAAEVKRRKEKNIGHLEIIAYDNKALGVGLPPVTDKELKLFAEYAVNVIGDLVELYGDNLQVEIWNEYNNADGRFKSIDATPENYADMLKYTYPAIKAKYPNVFVWGLDMYKIDMAWAERVFAAGGLDYMDGISLHPYNSNTTPDNGGQIAQTAEFRELIKKYTDRDIKLLASEWGYSAMNYGTFPNKVTQGSYIVRQQVLNSAYDMYESIYWYTANDGGEIPNSLEYNFGLLKGPSTKVPYGVKPAYLAIANYNKTMMNAEFVDKADIGDDITAYKFRLADGRDCVVAWKVNAGEEIAAVSLGADSAVLMDMYGNETQLGSFNGAFHVRYDTTPVYLIGSFPEMKKAERIFEFDTDTVKIPSGDGAVVKLYQYTDKKGRVEVIGNDDITVADNSGFIGDVTRLQFASKGNPIRENDGETYGDIDINIYDGEKLIFATELDVNYIPKTDVNIKARPHDIYNSDWWQLVAEVTNHSLGETEGVAFRLIEPEELSRNVGEIKLSIPAGNTKEIKINLPNGLLKDKKIRYKADVEFAGGEKRTIENEAMLYACEEAGTAPVIDGKISKGEWSEGLALTPSEGQYVYITGNSYGGAEDVSGTIYTAWDRDNFYLGAKVTDDVLSDDTVYGGVFWRSDGIQIAFSPYKGSTEVSQLDFAQINGENRLTVEKNPVAAAIGEVDRDKFDFELAREGNVTTYEIRIPWEVIFPSGYRAEKNGELAITLLINDNDGDQREGYYEYGSGMGTGSTNSAEYNLFYLLGKSLMEDLT